MRRLLLLVATVAGAAALWAGPTVTPAQAFCDTSEGCSPCPPPTVVLDGKNTRIEWVYC